MALTREPFEDILVSAVRDGASLSEYVPHMPQVHAASLDPFGDDEDEDGAPLRACRAIFIKNDLEERCSLPPLKGFAVCGGHGANILKRYARIYGINPGNRKTFKRFAQTRYQDYIREFATARRFDIGPQLAALRIVVEWVRQKLFEADQLSMAEIEQYVALEERYTAQIERLSRIEGARQMVMTNKAMEEYMRAIIDLVIAEIPIVSLRQKLIKGMLNLSAARNLEILAATADPNGQHVPLLGEFIPPQDLTPKQADAIEAEAVRNRSGAIPERYLPPSLRVAEEA